MKYTLWHLNCVVGCRVEIINELNKYALHLDKVYSYLDRCGAIKAIFKNVKIMTMQNKVGFCLIVASLMLMTVCLITKSEPLFYWVMQIPLFIGLYLYK